VDQEKLTAWNRAHWMTREDHVLSSRGVMGDREEAWMRSILWHNVCERRI
jgi:hypothetical protein